MDDIAKRAAEALELLPEQMQEAAVEFLHEQGQKLRVLRKLVQEGLDDVEAGRVVEWDMQAFREEAKALNDQRQVTSKKVDALEIGARIEGLRPACGLGSQAALGKRLGVAHGRINNWTSGRTPVPIEFALKLRNITGATLDYIYCGDQSGLPLRLADALRSNERDIAGKVLPEK